MLQQQKLVIGGASAGAKHEITQVKVFANSVSSAHNLHIEIWTDSSNSPGSQIGGDSDSLNVSSSGEKTITFSSPVDVTAYVGQVIWVIYQADGGDVNYRRHTSGNLDGGVRGGDFEASTTITNLVGASSIVPRAEVTFSDGSTTYEHGQAAGTTAIGLGGSFCMGTQIIVPPAGLVSIDASTLTTIGNMTGDGGLAAAFDGNLSQTFSQSASRAPDCTVGVDHTTPVLLRQVWVYAPSNSGPNWKRHLRMYGASNADADTSTATLLGTLVSDENSGNDYFNNTGEIAEFSLADLTQTAFRYHFLECDADGGTSYVAELRMYR